jgi:type IV pilus assembly protein PilW
MWNRNPMSTERRKVWGQGEQHGFTLIEILIALLIGVFLLAALLTIVQANRRVYGDQSQLAQLQDSERMAMTLMTDVIQMAGYFPNPTANTSGGSLTATGPFLTAGQPIFGTFSSTTPGDSISIRYMTAGSDGILNCSGLSNPNAVGGANILYVNTFQVVNGQLVCTLTSSAAATPVQYNLVNGVTNATTAAGLGGVVNLSILYGVKTNAGAAGNAVDTYLNASQVTAANDWNSIISVLIELTFTNPLFTNGSTTQPKTLEIQRVVGVMNQLGPVN